MICSTVFGTPGWVQFTMASEEDDKTSAWDYPVVAAICAFAAVVMYFDNLPPFIPKRDLATSQGIMIAIERVRWDDDLALRLSDSERWYTFPFVEDDALGTELRRARTGAIVIVAHAPPGPAPPPGDRHYVTAYALAIDGNEVLTYERSRDGYDSWLHPKWLSAFMACMAVFFAVLAWRRKPATTLET